MSVIPFQVDPPRRVESCLVVDDDTFDRMMLRRCLGRDRPGLRIVERSSLSGARDFLASDRPDLIVLDHRLPDGEGAEFAAELRREPALRDTMICLVTSQDPAALETTVPALSKEALDSRALWSMVGEYLDLCHIAKGSDEAQAVTGFGEAMQRRIGPQMSRMLRSVRSAQAGLGGAAPRLVVAELERLETMILALSDLVAETGAEEGAAGRGPGGHGGAGAG